MNLKWLQQCHFKLTRTKMSMAQKESLKPPQAEKVQATSSTRPVYFISRYSTDKLEEPHKKRKYIKKSKFRLQKKKKKPVFKFRSKVTPSNPNSSSYVASSSQLLDYSGGQPVHLNSENVNNIPLQQDNNVEQDSHLDASSEGVGQQ